MADEVLRRMEWSWSDEVERSLLAREWLVTNGLGGYASGSISGACTRRFHGLLVAALPAPLGRVMMFSHLAEQITLPDGRKVDLWGRELAQGALELHGAKVLREFRLEHGLPVWRFDVDGVVLEKRIFLPHLQNSVQMQYRLLSASQSVRLRLRPSLHMRPHEGRVDAALEDVYRVVGCGCHFEVEGPRQYPPLRLRCDGENAAFVLDGGSVREYLYRLEASRGYDARGSLWSPGYLRADVSVGRSATLIASTEDWTVVSALSPEEAWHSEIERRRRLLARAPEAAKDGARAPKAAREGVGAELSLAADLFIITPLSRMADAARAHASGDEVRTIIAGYHWFTDWGRDTMVSLEGLTLCTGRWSEARWILRTFAHYVHDGLIPNHFPEHGAEGVYHTADATLWFFHALHRYVRTTADRTTLGLLLPALDNIIDHHHRGTQFGIGVDPKDGLLKQGTERFPLTWMDARVEDWVVTPRRGKAVEINALWYNALRLAEAWAREEGREERAALLKEWADRVFHAFNERFWDEKRGYLYDVVDGESGDDPALRPNQLFAISLDYPILDLSRWPSVVEVCTRELLTPAGLRTLAPGHPDYKPRYYGDLRSRDAAYHQGTVWPWLIGPYVDAWLKVNPGKEAEARKLLERFSNHLSETCVGSIGEIFDAEPPFAPRGCIAQAWSVAEVLRAWVRTACES